jgi:hypothetical protein
MSTTHPLSLTGIHGAHLRRDVLAHAGRHRLAAALAAREVAPLWPHVVVETPRLLDPRTRAAAALLTTGPEAVLCGATAAFLHGCPAAAGPEIHVLMPYEHFIRGRKGLIMHRGRGFADEIQIVDGLRVLPLDRAIADLLCLLPWRNRGGDALAVLDQALRSAGDDIETFRKAVQERLAHRADPRGTRHAAFLLDLGSGRVDSPAESWLRLVLVEHGLPVPEVNWSINTPDGREIRRLDLAWPGLRVCLEYDGWESHVGREEQDEARAAELRRHGWIVVRAFADDLGSPARLISELRSAFGRRGYVW